jgi:galactoside O-acetyltransferase
VRIGNNAHIGAGVSIFGTHGVIIGDGVSLSPGSKIFTATDDPSLEMVTNPQIADRMGTIGQVQIGDYSSIGANSVILPGVTIEDEVQVGALSLVKNSLRRNGVYAGVPAKYIKPRATLIYGNHASQS